MTAKPTMKGHLRTAAGDARMRDADLAAARNVLAREIDGLKKLTDAFDATLSAALDILANVQGRVVVTGMGKSGHIGRKIAATLASTGTPALFVHPAEANHGDLGMITRADAILLLSNSGETDELMPLVAYARRFDIPMIAMTSDANSTLARHAVACLALPAAEEACPMGLAPTTSTTMMLALGDALAIALLERKRALGAFSSEQFHTFHPGGRLGRQLMPVSSLMHRGDELPLVTPDLPTADAILVMTARRFGCVGVVDGSGGLIGIVTDGDLRRHMAPDLLRQPVDRVMTRQPVSVSPDRLVGEALGIMNARAITSLFVVEHGRPVGILHIHDCLRAGVA